MHAAAAVFSNRSQPVHINVVVLIFASQHGLIDGT
jgi:hypothetical protein